MQSFVKILSTFAILLGIFNLFGGIVSGIWLVILGEWGVIGYGILALIVSSMGISFAMCTSSDLI